MKRRVPRLDRLLLHRRVTLVVVLLVAASALSIALIPQQPSQAAAALPAAVRMVGLDRVATMWWFRAIVALAALQLAAVTLRLARRDARRLLREHGPAGSAFSVTDSGGLVAVLRRFGYIRVRRLARIARYVKHPWGYFGATVLHGGMLLAVIGVLAVTLTRSVGLVTMVEGQTLDAGTSLEAAVRGPLGEPTVLESALTLERIDARFWETGEPRRYTCTYVLGDGSAATRFDVTTNAPQVVGGVRYHQENRVGYSFFVTITQPDVTLKQRLDLMQPSSAGEASYLDRVLPGGDLLRAKCMVDEAVGAQPELTLRLMRDGNIAGEATLTQGASARLADADVTVDAVQRWAILTIERSRGYGLLFTSFFVIFLGAVLIYGATPRELTLTKHEDGAVAAEWYTPRFATLLETERQRLEDAASAGKERS